MAGLHSQLDPTGRGHCSTGGPHPRLCAARPDFFHSEGGARAARQRPPQATPWACWCVQLRQLFQTRAHVPRWGEKTCAVFAAGAGAPLCSAGHLVRGACAHLWAPGHRRWGRGVVGVGVGQRRRCAPAALAPCGIRRTAGSARIRRALGVGLVGSTGRLSVELCRRGWCKPPWGKLKAALGGCIATWSTV